ncbi:MAG TPA: UbiA family prenyltransferase [Verrucomicrobiae bacterium]|nr:UbiA family prenyltransferase [Verrucomicrobiae bacterium]
MANQPSKFLVYARLFRLPSAFTVMADPLAGWFAVGGGVPAWELPLLVGASACFYTSGSVFNDHFDYDLDLIDHPDRPLPSGAVSLKTARLLGAVLMIAALGLAALAGPVPFGVGTFLGAMIFFYNAWARRFAVLRPLVLGTCRFANFLLGMRCLPVRMWWMPATLGAYAVIITLLSRREPNDPVQQPVIQRLLLGIIVVDALVVLLSPFGDWIGALLVLSLLVPAVVLDNVFTANRRH